MQVWNALHVARWKYRTQKNRHLGTIAQLCRAISSQLSDVWTVGKNLLSSNTSSTCPDNMVSFGPLTAEIGSGVWGTSPNFNGFRVLAALLHALYSALSTLVLGVSQTLRRWTEGATYIRQGGHHVGHWPTLLVFTKFLKLSNYTLSQPSDNLSFRIQVFCATSPQNFMLVTNMHNFMIWLNLNVRCNHVEGNLKW